MKRAVITGGAGFIGSHLADELVKQGYRVIIIDDLSSGKESNVAKLLREERASFTKDSVLSLSRLEKTFEGATYVFHFADLSNIAQSFSDPKLAHDVNATGTLNVLLAARRQRVTKVVYASSKAIYGDNQVQPLREDMPAIPKSPYAVSKLAGEYYCNVFHEAYSLSTVVLRYFNVYGPRQSPARDNAGVVSKFIDMASHGKSMAIFGDGETTRDFLYVKDAAKAAILAAESDTTGIYNVGSGQSTKINQLAQAIIGVTGSNKTPVYKPERDADLKHSLADISKAKGFGFQPEFDLESGLKDMINPEH